MQVIPYDPPKPAPAFTLPDLDGKEYVSPTRVERSPCCSSGHLVTRLPEGVTLREPDGERAEGQGAGVSAD